MKSRRSPAVGAQGALAANETDPGASTPASGERVAGARLGWLTAESTPSSPVVDYQGNVLGSLAARTTMTMNEAELARAVATRQPVTIVFKDTDPRFPIVIGLVHEAPSPLRALLAEAPPSGSVDATLDGQRVTLTAEREIVLKCGTASLTLRRDGKVILRGSYVETHAGGTNRIKGGQVKIN